MSIAIAIPKNTNGTIVFANNAVTNDIIKNVVPIITNIGKIGSNL